MHRGEHVGARLVQYESVSAPQSVACRKMDSVIEGLTLHRIKSVQKLVHQINLTMPAVIESQICTYPYLAHCDVKQYASTKPQSALGQL